MAIHFINFDILKCCILLTFGSVYTKLGDFVKQSALYDCVDQ